jgi:hypothetical protein
MIPLDSSNLRDFVFACVIGASFYGLVRSPHYLNKIPSRVEIFSLSTLVKGGEAGEYRFHLKAGKDEVQQKAPFAHVKVRPERWHW